MTDDTPINPELPRMTMNITNDTDPTTVWLQSWPHTQSNTIHPDKFKLIVALSSRFPNHQDTSRIITVLLRLTPVHQDGAMVLLRIRLMYPHLTNRVNHSSAVAQNRECVTGA